LLDKFAFLFSLAASVLCLLGALLFASGSVAGKLLNTCSALLGLSSIFQLKVSGWFQMVSDVYLDEKNYPFGPTSAITRQIIDNPDAPIESAIRNMLFFNPETGAYLAIASLMIAAAASWV
jgi:hypothetical protein